MQTQKILVDETVFVYAKRANINQYSNLMRFLSLSDVSNPDKKYRLYMCNTSFKRLGISFGYILSRYILRMNKLNGFHKREERRKAALKHVSRVSLLPSSFSYYLALIIPYHQKRCLMDLFLIANEAKALELMQKGEELKPSEVIPLEMCQIAQIAHSKNLPIFSFNEDFKFFCGLPHKPKKYIEFLEPKGFLRNLPS